MNPWLQLLGSGGLAGIAVVVVNVLANRRNLGAQSLRTDAEAHRTDAETDEIIAKTARGMVADVRAQLDLERSNRHRLEDRVAELEREADEQRRVLILHAAWDLMAISKVRECVPPVDLPHPPPLTPPIRRRKHND